MKQSIVKNTFYNLIYRAINIIYPLITTMYVSHVLLADGVGKVNFALNIAQYFVLLAPLGIPNYGTREIAKVKANKDYTNMVFSELFFLNLFSTFLCSITYYALVLSIENFRQDFLLYAIVGFQIVFNVFNIEWVYLAFEEFKYITVRNLIIKILSLILLFVFVKEKQDYIFYGLIYSLGIIGNNVLNICNLKKIHITILVHDLKMQKHLKAVFMLFATTIAIEVYTLLDTTMLGFMQGDLSVAYYSNSSKIAKVLISIIASIGAVLLPRISFYVEKGMRDEIDKIIQIASDLIVFISLPTACGLIIYADHIVSIILGNSFVPAIGTLRISALLLLVLGLNNLYGTQVLIAFNAERKLLVCTICAAIINVSLNWVLIPKYGTNGAMIASFVSEVFVLILTFCYSKTFIRISIHILDIIKMILLIILMSLLLLFEKSVIYNTYWQLFIGTISGSFVYLLGSYALRIPIMREICGQICGQIRKKV